MHDDDVSEMHPAYNYFHLKFILIYLNRDRIDFGSEKFFA